MHGRKPSAAQLVQGTHKSAGEARLLCCVRVSSRNHCRSTSLAAGDAALRWLSAGLRLTYTLRSARFTSR